MKDIDRIDEILNILREYWLLNPNLRLGQIVSNANICAGTWKDCFYLEDDDLKDALCQWLKKEE